MCTKCTLAITKKSAMTRRVVLGFAEPTSDH